LHPRRRKLSALLVVATVSSMVATGQVAQAAPPAAHATTATTTRTTKTTKTTDHRTAGRYTVTLVTGDRVSIASATATTGVITPGQGRAHLNFATYHRGGHLYVIPRDALGLVAQQKLDQRLFDVTGLVKLGYDDAHRGTLPLIVGYQAGFARPNVAGARTTRSLPAVNGAALLADKAKSGSVWSSMVSGAGSTRAKLAGGVKMLWLDGKRQLADDVSVPQIGAPTAWAAGYKGDGVTVAVLDGGIDATHPDLAGKVVDAQNFTDDPDPTDTFGHGTHVASIIAGTGAASGGKYTGVAPDATLYAGKVCVNNGCDDSAILAGMQWAAAEKHAKVINLSLGGGDAPDIDPLEEAVNTLTAQYGSLFVIAAGNSGPDDATVGSPGSADAALTVGAVDKDDQLAFFSSRGPRVGDGAVKPDITAPGVDIIAARAAGTELGDPVGDSYVILSGTSMATPHVAGSAALLAEEHPDWSAPQLKAALMASAKPNPDLTAYQQGAGRVDVARAIAEPVTSEPTSLSLGVQSFPHTDDTPIVKTLTYHNSGTASLTLSLTPHIVGPGGAAAPAGMFTFSANQLTVPAGGSASVTLTTDTAVDGPDGLYSGEITATAGDVQAETPIGVNKEVESYNVTLVHTDRTGAPATGYLTVLTDLTGGASYPVFGADAGTITVRVPKATYDLFTFINTQTGPETGNTTLLSQPVLNVTKDVTVNLDARKAGVVRESVPDPTAVPALLAAEYDHIVNGNITGAGVLGLGAGDVYIGHLGGKVPGTDYIATEDSQWMKPTPDGGFDASAYFYALGDYQYGQLPNGFSRDYHARDLATLQTTYAAVKPGDLGLPIIFASFPQDAGGWAVVTTVSLPLTRPEYVTGSSTIKWSGELDVGTVDPDGFLEATSDQIGNAVAYRAGQHYRQRYNDGPFGPALPASTFAGAWVFRFGDEIDVDPPLFSDADGHAGFALTDTSSTALYRDGTLVSQTTDPFATFTVPADEASYRLVSDATRSGYTDLTTGVHVEWTFNSAHTPDDAFTPLPLSTIQFTPKLTDNTAPAGCEFDIPVSVPAQAGTAARVNSLTVDVSYNDGKTWSKAAVRRAGDGWVARVRHPAGSGYASLRATAKGPSGNAVTETLIHAYRLA
jgi:subtilisin family serine protease